MSRWRSEALRWLPPRRAPAWQLYRAQQQWWALAPGAARAERAESLAAWAAAQAGSAVWLWLESSHVHHLPLPTELPLQGEAAVLDYARLQFAQYFGGAAAHWPLAAWQNGGQRHVWALSDAELVHSLATLARAHRLRWLGLRPAWAGLLERQATRPGGLGAARQQLAVLEGQQLTCLRLEQGQLLSLQQGRVDSAELPAAFDADMPTQWFGWGARPGLPEHPALAAAWGPA